MTWNARVLTIFPEAFPGSLAVSLIGKALAQRLWRLEIQDIRQSAFDRHRSVDDRPFGGGAGMVLRPDVLGRAIDSARKTASESSPLPCLLMSARGQPLSQARLKTLAKGSGVIIICARFEGVDQRVIEAKNLQEVSIGDYVLAGGEVAAMALIEGCVRLIPGVVGDQESLDNESFEQGLLEYPHYTKPREWQGLTVPEILLSGNHQNIAKWRWQQAIELTKKRRSDIYRQWSIDNQALTRKNPDDRK